MTTVSMHAQLSDNAEWNDAMYRYGQAYLAARALADDVSDEVLEKTLDAETEVLFELVNLPSPDLNCLLWKIEHVRILADEMKGAPDGWLDGVVLDMRNTITKLANGGGNFSVDCTSRSLDLVRGQTEREADMMMALIPLLDSKAFDLTTLQ